MFVGFDKLSQDPYGSSRAKASFSSQSVANNRKSPTLGQRRSDGSNQHGMITRFKEKASNLMQRQATGTSVDVPPNTFKFGDRVMFFNKHAVRIPGVVRWVGKVTNAGFTAVGIETVRV